MNIKDYVGALQKCDLLICVKPDKRKKTPHFTVVDPITGRFCDICISEAKYTKRYHYGDLRLTKLESKELQEWMISTANYSIGKLTITNYETIVDLWNHYNPDLKLNDDITQPDYSLLYKTGRSLVFKLLEGE